MVTQENSNKTYPLMVAHHQVELNYSIISQKIIHSVEIGTFSLLSILKWFALNWLTFGDDYVAFYNRIGPKGNLGNTKTSTQIQKEVLILLAR